MRANELRVGNWVLDHNDRICVVEKIDRFHNSVKLSALDGGYNFESCQIEEIKPITLTEELLVKLGCENDTFIDFRWYKEWNGSVILAYDLVDNSIQVVDTWEFPSRKYLHQFQNLYYALTNEELTLNK